MGIFSRQKSTQQSLKKYDGVIEAVRRDADGQIEVARFYERRGSAWSDFMLTDRKDLIARLKKGQKFVIGERKIYWAGTFNVVTQVQLTSVDGKERLTTGLSPNGKLELKEAPLF